MFSEEFNKPKIMYPNMTKYMPFYLDSKCFFQNDKSFMITGKYIYYLLAFLNSSLFKFCFRDYFPELQGGTRELRKIFIDKLPVKIITEAQNDEFMEIIDDIQTEYNKSKAIAIDTMIFDLYNLSEEERQTIGFVEIE